MAYTFFPIKAGEIISKCRSKPDSAAEIIELFKYLTKKFKQVKTPVNIDVQKLGIVNVSRELQGMIEIKDIQKEVELKHIKIKFGAGSAGNRGVKNRGNLFENTFANAIRKKWDSDEKATDPNIANAVNELAKIYKFDKLKGLIVKEEGAMNVKRPLVFKPGPYITSPTSSLDIGRTVTDLTLHEAKNISQARPNNVVGYLSLKLGTTTTFFNIGIRTILTPDEIKTGTIKNKDGIRLLNMLGIDNQTFCKIFNGRLKKGVKTNTFSKANRRYLETFLQSGIGYGFCVVHKLSNKVKTFKIDKQYMQRASKPMSCDVYYGGKTGTGKRVDIEIQTPLYLFKLNMRDTQGKDGYPTRLMGDFTYR
tara:strand:+ start:450 stop:1541 length:1092 start_codon:yes stop_codon:yes gene_type:complete